jgi:hypothetical protein
VATTALPAFRYHPDPVATGSVQASSTACVVCDEERGYVYAGPVYAEDDYDEQICPWCIADGTAASKLGAFFADVGWGVPDDTPEAVTAELAARTPGFTAWQEPHWLYHCGDGCAFLGAAGRQELASYPDALEALMHEHDEYGWDRSESQEYVDALRVDGAATAYLFRCLVCGAHLAFSGSD